MRIAFVPQAGALGLGGVTRCLALAEAAALRGHSVAFFVPDSYPLIEDAGLYTRMSVPRPLQHEIGVGEAASFAESLAIRGLLDEEYLQEAIRVEEAALREFKADVVLTENQPTVPLSCHRLGIPFAAIAATINLRQFAAPVDPYCEAGLLRVARSMGVDALDSEGLLHGCAAVNIAPTIEVLEPSLAGLPNVRYVGPLLYGRVELREFSLDIDERSLVLVYLSRGLVTIKNVMPALAFAFPEDEYRVLIVSGLDEVAVRTPRNVRTVPLLGITRALKLCDVVVTRGGQNTLMACMLAGRPVIGMPGRSAEPIFNLQGLASLGAARLLPGIPSGEGLAAAVVELTAGGAARCASAIGDLLRRLDGPVGAIRALEDLAL